MQLSSSHARCIPVDLPKQENACTMRSRPDCKLTTHALAHPAVGAAPARRPTGPLALRCSAPCHVALPRPAAPWPLTTPLGRQRWGTCRASSGAVPGRETGRCLQKPRAAALKGQVACRSSGGADPEANLARQHSRMQLSVRTVFWMPLEHADSPPRSSCAEVLCGVLVLVRHLRHVGARYPRLQLCALPGQGIPVAIQRGLRKSRVLHGPGLAPLILSLIYIECQAVEDLTWSTWYGVGPCQISNTEQRDVCVL